MALFQNSVLKKHLKLQDQKVIEKAFKKYAKYFHNTAIQQNIRESKEEQYQEGFLRELFVNILDYAINPNPNFNLTTELKNEKGAKKADGAILNSAGKALAVIELKGTKTKDLESIRQQAFDYKANHSECIYVITSNFEKLRFYINNAVEFEEFNLFTLTAERFELLYLCLHKENLLQNLPLKVNTDSVVAEEQITKTFYNDYSVFKRELFRDLVKTNVKNEVFREELIKDDNDRATKNIKLTLFKKSQKLIDRFLFIFFAEDKGLLPPNSTLQILDKWKADLDFGDERPLYNLFKQYFKFLDQGRAGTNSRAEIFAYNGGLFKPDPILDSLLIDNDLLFKHTKTLSDYDFESQVGVNILGHIFENSLNEIESVNAEIEGQEFDKQKTKRKKDGVFYTPKYITKYIVDNTVGKLCDEKKTELGVIEAEYQKSRKGRNKDTLKKLKNNLDNYRNWLLEITILDPACGSGAFLNQALDFLIKEHTYIDELETALLGGGVVFPNIENTILEKNIFGVDLNEESVEIAKLSLWLRTAQPRRKLNSLNNNIKCGNSLIDDPKIAGDKAFNWQNEFPTVFEEKDKRAFHITTATHDSRTSQRMIDYKVRLLRDNGTRPKAEGIWIEPKNELLIIKTVAEIVEKDKLNVLAFNLCGDHMHLLLVCEEDEVSKIVGKIKAVTSKIYNTEIGITIREEKSESDTTRGQSESDTTRGHVPLSKQKKKTYNSLWTQKFGNNPIKDDQQLWNTVNYIQKNRAKHDLPAHSKEIKALIQNMCVDFDTAMKPEFDGGFDVVIGNPPYVRKQGLVEHYPEMTVYYEKTFQSATGNYDIYALFMEHCYNLINENGIVSFILPHKFLVSDFGVGIRAFVTEHTAVEKLIHFGSDIVFKEASTYTCIVDLTKTKKEKVLFKKLKPEELLELSFFDKMDYNNLSEQNWDLQDESTYNLIEKLKKQPYTVDDVFDKIFQGIATSLDAVYVFKGEDKGTYIKGYNEKFDYHFEIEKELVKPFIKGNEISKNKNLNNKYYVFFPYSREGAPILEDYIKSTLPKTYLYLKHFEKEIRGRERGRMDIEELWYLYIYPKNLTKFHHSKIMTQEISLGCNMTYDEEGVFYHPTTIYSFVKNEKFIVDEKFYLGILNSKVMWFFIKNTSTELSGGYFRFKTNYLKPFPLPKISGNSNELIENVNLQLKENKDFQTISTKFTKYLKSQFSIKKLTKKLQNWHQLEFGEFIKELNKAIKKENKERMSMHQGDASPCLIATLTKTDEMDWMDVFETKKAEAQTLKAEIDKTDKEIDQMVYELYELTADEIEIIENSTK